MTVETPVEIRTMVPGDVPALVQFIANSPLWQRYDISDEKAQRILEAALQRGEALYVALVDGHLAGFIWFLLRGTFAHSGYVRLVGVLPEFRGRGVGTKLMATVETIIGREAPSVFLLTSDFNEDAQAFYRRLGYQQVGAIPDYVVPGITELIFYKRLW